MYPRLNPFRPRPRSAWLVLLLLIGAARFVYGLSASPAGWLSPTYMDVVYERQSSGSVDGLEDGSQERRWGPLFFLGMRALRRAVPDPQQLRLLERVLLTGLYVWTEYLLIRLLRVLDLHWLEREGTQRKWVLLFLFLQSTAAIYAITNGMGEIVSAFCIVAHFHYFVRRQFLVAALLITIGVYFKLYPIVFLFPYALFSIASREHRRYVACLAGSVILVALPAMAGAGWVFGPLYPLSMFRLVMTQPSVIPLRSKEVFGLLFFVTRMLTSFSVQHPDPSAAALGRMLASAFTMMLMGSTAACAVVLRIRERGWAGEEGRRHLDLLIFQTAIGFLMLSFSPDVSITLLLPAIISLYAPLLIWSDPVRHPKIDARAIATWSLFVVGSILCGNLVPLSALLKVLPLRLLDQLAGNAVTDLIPHEKLMWYQVPMLGVYCLAAATGLSLTTTRRRSPRPVAPG